MNSPRSVIILFASAWLLQPLTTCAQDADSLNDTPLELMSGKEIYLSYCSRCHGIEGRGEIPQDMVDNMEAPPPDLTDPYFSSREKRADWIAVVRSGGPARGLSASMPAWEGAISEQQMAETVEHMKSFVDQTDYPQGELNFFRTHTVTKAFVEQEALIIPRQTWIRTETGTLQELRTILYYANRFGNRFQYEVKLPVFAQYGGGTSSGGVGDLEFGLKYAWFDNYRTLTILSAGLEMSVPTGSESDGFGAGTVIAVPYVAAGQGIANWLQLQGSAKLEAPLERAKGTPEVVYGASATIVTGESKQGLFPGIEFNGTLDTGSADHAESVIPTLYWGITPRGHLALSVGYDIPLNTPKPFDGRIHAFLLWDFVDGGIWW